MINYKEKIQAETIRNIVLTAEEHFTKEQLDEKCQYIMFMIERFGKDYQTKDYCKTWIKRIQEKNTDVMDGTTLRVYEWFYQ